MSYKITTTRGQFCHLAQPVEKASKKEIERERKKKRNDQQHETFFLLYRG